MLFYLEKLSCKDQNPSSFSQGYFFIALKRKALELLHKQRKYAYYITLYPKDYEPFYLDKRQTIISENEIDIKHFILSLSVTEQKILLLFAKGETISNISQKLLLSRQSIYRILKKIQRNFKLLYLNIENILD